MAPSDKYCSGREIFLFNSYDTGFHDTIEEKPDRYIF